MEVICSAPSTCPSCNQGSSAQRAQKLAEHIDGELWKREAINVLRSLRLIPRRERRELLEEKASEAGIRNCRLARDVHELAF